MSFEPQIFPPPCSGKKEKNGAGVWGEFFGPFLEVENFIPLCFKFFYFGPRPLPFFYGSPKKVLHPPPKIFRYLDLKGGWGPPPSFFEMF